MTRDAINRRVVLPVAFDAKTHGVIDFALGDGHGVQVAVAFRAIHTGANMRSVIELHVRRRLEAVHALPGNILSARLVRREFLDFGLVGGDGLMASHANIDAGDARVRPLVDAGVAKDALEAVREVNLVRIRDRLDGRGAPSEKFPHSVPDAAMFGGENAGFLIVGRRWRGRILRPHRADKDCRANGKHAEENRDSNATISADQRQERTTLVEMFSAGGLDILHSHSRRVNFEFDELRGESFHRDCSRIMIVSCSLDLYGPQPLESQRGETMAFNVSVRQVGSVTLVTIAGSVMWAEAEALHDMFRDLLAKGQKRIVLNLSSVKHLDSSGIGALAWAYVTVRKAGGELKMIHLSKQVQYLMELTSLYKIFEDFADEESALKSFK